MAATTTISPLYIYKDNRSYPTKTNLTYSSESNPRPNLVDKIVDSTYLGANYTASAVSGVLGGAGAYLTSAPGAILKATGSFYKNFWKTEVIGPNLKVIGSVLAAPVVVLTGAIGVPASLVMGLYHGIRQVDSSHPRRFTVGKAFHSGYEKVNRSWKHLARDLENDFDELGDEKLKPGEKPLDIPLLKLGKTILVGALGATVGSLAGITGAVAATVQAAVSGVVKTIKEPDLNLLEKAAGATGSILGAPLHGTMYGIRTALGTTFDGIKATWSNDSLIKGGRTVFQTAGRSIKAAASPDSMVKYVTPKEPQPNP